MTVSIHLMLTVGPSEINSRVATSSNNVTLLRRRLRNTMLTKGSCCLNYSCPRWLARQRPIRGRGLHRQGGAVNTSPRSRDTLKLFTSIIGEATDTETQAVPKNALNEENTTPQTQRRSKQLEKNLYRKQIERPPSLRTTCEESWS